MATAVLFQEKGEIMYTLKIGYTEVFRTSQLDVLTTLIEDLLEHNEIPIRIEVNKAIEEKENG